MLARFRACLVVCHAKMSRPKNLSRSRRVSDLLSVVVRVCSVEFGRPSTPSFSVAATMTGQAQRWHMFTSTDRFTRLHPAVCVCACCLFIFFVLLLTQYGCKKSVYGIRNSLAISSIRCLNRHVDICSCCALTHPVHSINLFH